MKEALPFRSVKIWRRSYVELKLLAAKRGTTFAKLVDDLVNNASTGKESIMCFHEDGLAFATKDEALEYRSDAKEGDAAIKRFAEERAKKGDSYYVERISQLRSRAGKEALWTPEELEALTKAANDVWAEKESVL